jgi:amidohydrolase
VAAIVNATNAIHSDPTVSHSAKVTRCFAGGEAVNIIPDRAEISFDLRSTTNEVMDDLKAKCKRAIEAGAASVGATAEIVSEGGVPAASFDPTLVEETRASIEAALGAGKSVPPLYTPGSEDFHCYSVEAGIKSSFIGVGGDMGTGGHTTTMRLDLSALSHGAKVFVHLAASKLC